MLLDLCWDVVIDVLASVKRSSWSCLSRRDQPQQPVSPSVVAEIDPYALCKKIGHKGLDVSTMGADIGPVSIK